ncbi:hypothetical protein DH2020_046629 [Rehmannia glutinosa]|uniref:Guanine nucleotide-binding protein alpha-1 subunit n=1 Tax=Rehmannia glutinosa TaxID=99300 RepID=A0ABR0UCB6_REHGL
MGLLCSRQRHSKADSEENEQTAEIERRIEQETKAEKHIQKLLLLGAGDSGKSTIFKQARCPILFSIKITNYLLHICLHIFADDYIIALNAMQIKLLFQSGFDEAELKGYIPVIHANVYQTIKVLHDGSKELSQSSEDSSKFSISDENKQIGEKFSEIGSRLDYPRLTKELAHEIETLWRDNAIQETYSRGNELQVPDCTHYFMESLQRLSDADYVPTKSDCITSGLPLCQYGRIEYSLSDGLTVNKFDICCLSIAIHLVVLAALFTNEDVLYARVRTTGVVEIQFRYDQTLFEDDNKNRMMETKELFEWVLKQPCFEKTSFMLFLNKFDLFEKKVLKVPLNVCGWFKDYQPVSTGKQETENAYETTALDQKLVKKTFKLVDETLRRRNLFEAGLLPEFFVKQIYKHFDVRVHQHQFDLSCAQGLEQQAETYNNEEQRESSINIAS